MNTSVTQFHLMILISLKYPSTMMTSSSTPPETRHPLSPSFTSSHLRYAAIANRTTAPTVPPFLPHRGDEPPCFLLRSHHS